GDHCHPRGRSHQFGPLGSGLGAGGLTGIGRGCFGVSSLFLRPPKFKGWVAPGVKRVCGSSGRSKLGEGRGARVFNKSGYARTTRAAKTGFMQERQLAAAVTQSQAAWRRGTMSVVA